MMNYLAVEWLKLKETRLKKMLWTLPLFATGLSIIFYSLSGFNLEYVSVATVNQWGDIWLPMSVLLFCTLFDKLEKNATAYKMIYGRNISQFKTWLGKCIIVASLVFFSSLVLWGFLFFIRLLFPETSHPQIDNTHLDYFYALFMSFIAIIWQIPLYLWLSQKMNHYLLILIGGGISFVLGAYYAPTASWFFIPWAWILRFQAPFIGTHPNEYF